MRHKRTQHSKDGGRHFPCDVPGCSYVDEKAFTTLGSLKTHKRTQHFEDNGRFSCDVPGCSYRGHKVFQ